MKAILVIDMPKSCGCCDICGYDDGFFCQNGKSVDEYVEEQTKPDWCPLRPMPKRYVEDDFVIETPRDAEACTHGIIVGRNIVINEILGETE